MTTNDKHCHSPAYQEGFAAGVYSHEDVINVLQVPVLIASGRDMIEWYRGYRDGRARRNGHPR